MSLANGRPYLAIPGPSTMPDRVLGAMHRAAPNIYEGALIDETAQIVADLKRVAQCSSHVAIYIGNGHAAWEAVNTNLFSKGDKVLMLATSRVKSTPTRARWASRSCAKRFSSSPCSLARIKAMEPF